MMKLYLANIITLLIVLTVSATAQLARNYPNDIGIENDPDVLFVEKFEDPLDSIKARYTDVKNVEGMSLVHDVPSGSTGKGSITMTSLGGTNSGGHLFKRFSPGWDSTVYLRYYVKYPSVSKGYIHHESVWIGGYNPATPWPNPRAGTCGLGDARISIAYEPVTQTTMNTYMYWGDMHNDPNNNCWGNVMIRGELVAESVPYDDWLCVEMMVKLNNPVSEYNGELRIWHNDNEVGYWGPGFPNGSWTWDKFNVNKQDPPFSGFRWRTDPKLNLNYLWIEYYDDQSPAGISHYIRYDHIVVARKRIGSIYSTTGVRNGDSSAASFGVRPNPATTNLTISLPQSGKPSVITICNLLGERVYGASTTESEPQIDISMLSVGMYMVEVSSGGIVSHGRFMKR